MNRRAYNRFLHEKKKKNPNTAHVLNQRIWNPDWKDQSLVTDEEKKAPDMENHWEEDQGFKSQPDRGVTRRQKPVCMYDSDMQKAT